MKRIRGRYVFFSLSLIMLIVFLHVFQKAYSPPPLLLWNRTESAPLGIYRRIQVKHIRTGQIIYVSVTPDVLSRGVIRVSPADQQKLLHLQHTLQQRAIPLLKQLSLQNVNSIASKLRTRKHGKTCIDCILEGETLYVISSHKDGIDSKILGEIDVEDVVGFYVLHIQFN